MKPQSAFSRRRRLRFEALESRTMLAVNVVPTVETTADSGEEDDIAIWIHPTDASLSRVIGTVKTSASSLRVYNLQGQQVQSIAVANVNNVDLRYNFLLSGVPVAIVAGSNRSNDSIVLYKVDPLTGQLQNVAARTISTGFAVYGCALYVSPATGKYYAFISSESGQVQQWELFDNGAGKVDATQMRSFSVGSQAEGLVADDVLSYLYVGEENGGIWKYSAEPTGGSARTRVDTTGSGGHLTADVEGLTIYYAADGAGYLLASSQGNNEFVVYQRSGSNAYVNSFKLAASGSIDAVSDTDGIDVTNFPLGSQFPQGMFIAQDNNDNFKFARWDVIDAAFGGSLVSDTTWDPRVIGKAPDPNVSQGDFNRNGVVDAADYIVWRNLRGATSVPAYSGADANGDSTVDGKDYNIWRGNFGKATLAGAGSSPDVASSVEAIAEVYLQDGLDSVASYSNGAAWVNDFRGDETRWTTGGVPSRLQNLAILSWLGALPTCSPNYDDQSSVINGPADATDEQSGAADELNDASTGVTSNRMWTILVHPH